MKIETLQQAKQLEERISDLEYHISRIEPIITRESKSILHPLSMDILPREQINLVEKYLQEAKRKIQELQTELDNL